MQLVKDSKLVIKRWSVQALGYIAGLNVITQLVLPSRIMERPIPAFGSLADVVAWVTAAAATAGFILAHYVQPKLAEQVAAAKVLKADAP